MADEATTTETTTETPAIDGQTLVTGGAEQTPDKGDGEKKPDVGDGSKPADDAAKPTAEDTAAEDARRAALTDDERAAEDTAAEEARRAALTDEERAAEDAAKDGAPEEYAEFTAPEGVELDPEVLGAFKEIAKGDNLSQEKAQRYVDAAAQLVQKQGQQLADEIVATRTGWLEAAKTDPEFGGDKLPESLATAKRAIEAYGSPALTTLLDQTGLGNNPEIIRLLVKAGAAVSEDTMVSGHKAAVEPATLAERLYPPQGKKD
jgi:hypothetical protein